MKISAALVTLATVAVYSVSAQFTNLISAATSPIQYDGTNYTITPSPMCIGKEFCLTASGTLSTDIIEGAKYSIEGRYAKHFWYSDKKDLCPLLAASGTPCPVPAGAFNLKLCNLLKPNYPRGGWLIEFKFDVLNGGGDRIFAQKTPGYLSSPIKSSDPPLRAVECP